MKELQEMVSVVSKHKIKQIEVIGNDSDSPKSKFNQLYELVYNGEVKSDEEAIETLYPGINNASQAYSKLKSRLKSRLINTLFFIDVNQPQFTDIQQAFFTCNKNYLAARTLLTRGAINAAVKLAETTLKEAKHFEFTEIIIYLSKMLFWHYSLYDGHKKKYHSYLSIYNNSIQDLEAESLAEKYYTEVMLEYSSSQAKKANVINTLIKYSDDLTNKYPKVNSFRFIRISYLLHIIRYEVQGDFHGAIHACNEAIDIISSKPYNSKGAIFSFNNRLLSCLIQVKKYGDAEHIALKYSLELDKGSHNWYVIQLSHFLLHTHSGSYQKANDVLVEAVTHPNFEHLFPTNKQLWLVNQAYVYFLSAIGAIEQRSQESQYNFRIYKFLNEIPIYSKDKRGINITILIVHVLLLLQQRKFSQIIDRVDALNQYCHRYLRRDETIRANCFIKMLIQMAKADFNRKRTERYTEKYWRTLNENPFNVAEQGIEVEVIPYETLWPMVLDLLD